VALLNSIANRLKAPFPIVLVIGGLLLALIPGIPNVEFDPDLVLVVFLPPLLYSAAFFADRQAMRRSMR
jgi:CPA1 family monovalent cation:H+ antiporter